jgi:hypothetical protein
MRKTWIAAILMVLVPVVTSAECPDGGPTAPKGIRSLFARVPAPDDVQAADFTCKTWRPLVNIPALKLVQSTRPNAKVDVFLLTSVGGGLSYEKLKWNAATLKYSSVVSFSPLTLLITGHVTAATALDLSPALTVGGFNNLLMGGVGVDLGSVTGRSRVFGLLSIGVNFNN